MRIHLSSVLLLEPSSHPAVAPFREALAVDGIPFTSLAVTTSKPNTNASSSSALLSPNHPSLTAR